MASPYNHLLRNNLVTVRQHCLMGGTPGNEHYRLLAWVGHQLQNGIISEVGTMDGCGLLALSCNPSNKCYSYDIATYPDSVKLPENALKLLVYPTYMDQVVKSDIIHYDAAHEGKEEQEFYDELVKRDWKGILLLDDIYLNKPMNEFWNGITKHKEDWTDVGHNYGTGVVWFE